MSNEEYLYGKQRWCLWLKDANPTELKKCPKVLQRIENVKRNRLESTRPTTQKLAEYANLFGEIRQTESDYVLIPLHSSENRKYIPIGFFSHEYITHNSCSFIPNATLYDFGVLTSAMHMAWVNYVCGRIKSDYRYSNTIVYNNFPWPENISSVKKTNIEKLSQKVLDIRNEYPDSCPADLYNQSSMPADLRKAHLNLDKAVDKLYRTKAFINNIQRVELLFDMYSQATK